MRPWAEIQFQWYLQGILHVTISKTLFFLKRFIFFIMFAIPWPKAWKVLFDIVLSPNILICLVVQLRIGQAIDPCLYTTTYEAFAPSPRLVNLLSSSNFVLSSFFPRNLRANCERRCQRQDKKHQRIIPHVAKRKKRSTRVTSRMLPRARRKAPE